MPSGYEKSPDYGGPEPSWRELAAWLLACLAILAAAVVLVSATSMSFVKVLLCLVSAVIFAVTLSLAFKLGPLGNCASHLIQRFGQRRWELLRWSLVAALSALTVILLLLD